MTADELQSYIRVLNWMLPGYEVPGSLAAKPVAFDSEGRPLERWTCGYGGRYYCRCHEAECSYAVGPSQIRQMPVILGRKGTCPSAYFAPGIGIVYPPKGEGEEWVERQVRAFRYPWRPFGEAFKRLREDESELRKFFRALTEAACQTGDHRPVRAEPQEAWRKVRELMELAFLRDVPLPEPFPYPAEAEDRCRFFRSY